MSESSKAASKKRRGRKRMIKRMAAALAVLTVAGGIFIAATFYRVEKIEVNGNETYTANEIEDAVMADDYVPNTLVMTTVNRLFHLPYLPFIEEMRMSIKKPHILKITVKEKTRPGVFEYMNKHFYFDEDGTVMEIRNTLFENVPIVTGVKFREVKLEDTIKTEGNYVPVIVAIVRGISNYDLDISEIHFDGQNDITIYSGNYRIYLGSDTFLEEKLSRISSILTSVSEEHAEGIVDMHLFTDEKEYITFRETDDEN